MFLIRIHIIHLKKSVKRKPKRPELSLLHHQNSHNLYYLQDKLLLKLAK